ncbi:haloacid dehalogenase type II [Alicyclobacillus fastidiosus]|uniref:Haloacid dehalogenase type II n=1 Tax=Alicyclobacillus fastidiosus TaxID=392011 RepID=A0ABY6ZHN9_9BACL|nr:haloacid dehalogenase type II [Alicyclobacillus fastidiosus]WAH42405.1 haloacid dehalogenase type II [Alicyclobacillus fastidiosus]GMA64223.1 haloacid dehalogenase [Alicyclobacillus fastidiosus]
MIEAVVFDAYGTLFDVFSVEEACNNAFPGYGKQISEIWRQKQLEYTWLRALMRQYRNFEEVNRDSLKYTLNHLKLQYDDTTVETLLNAYLSLEHYPEVAEALHAFQPRKLAILSNGTTHMLTTVVQNAGLTSYFDQILSVDPLQTYKPEPQVYQLAVSTLGVAKEHILFVSSNGWDVAGSKAFGFTVGWINRQNKTTEELGVQPDHVVRNLLQLAEVISPK